MKIAHIVSTYPPYRGGMGNSVHMIARHLRELGEEPQIISPDYGRKNQDQANVIYLRPFLFWGNSAVLPQLFYRLRSYDLIHFHYPFYGSAEIMALYLLFRRPTSQKFVLHYHMDVSFQSLILKVLAWPDKCLRRILFRKADRIIVSSRDYADNSLAAPLFSAYKEKVVDIPFGVLTQDFRPGPRPETQVPKILFVGALDRAHYFKGLKFLIKTLAGLKEQRFSLEIIGSGDMLAEYQAYAKELGLEKKVVFKGGTDEAGLRRAYRQADIFILPSINRNEAFGLVLLEAMASALPLVAARLPGVRTVFQDGRQGYYFDPGDEAGLADAVNKLLSDRPGREEMGRQGRILALDRYDWRNTAKQIRDLYRIL